MFGRKGNMSRTIPTAGRAITGFVFRLADGIVCGAQVCFLNPDDTPTTRESTPVRHSSVLVGRDGLVRKIIVPPKEGRFVGLTGFINSAGFIETVGILERRITLTTPQIHPDASVWRLPAQLTDRERVVVPPSCVTLHEREGPYIPEWRTTGAEWAQDVWNVDDEGESTLYGPDIMPIPLENITGYFDNKFLRGLQFSYAGNTRTKLIGLKEGGNTYSMNLLEKERITACVISYDEEGVRGILVSVTPHPSSTHLTPQSLSQTTTTSAKYSGLVTWVPTKCFRQSWQTTTQT